jgi:hypothetical protein
MFRAVETSYPHLPLRESRRIGLGCPEPDRDVMVTEALYHEAIASTIPQSGGLEFAYFVFQDRDPAVLLQNVHLHELWAHNPILRYLATIGAQQADVVSIDHKRLTCPFNNRGDIRTIRELFKPAREV